MYIEDITFRNKQYRAIFENEIAQYTGDCVYRIETSDGFFKIGNTSCIRSRIREYLKGRETDIELFNHITLCNNQFMVFIIESGIKDKRLRFTRENFHIFNEYKNNLIEQGFVKNDFAIMDMFPAMYKGKMLNKKLDRINDLKMSFY